MMSGQNTMETETCEAGGVVKKTLYAAGAMTAAAAVCYPREATDISRYSWNVASQFAVTTYRDLFDRKFEHSDSLCNSVARNCAHESFRTE